jgi:hypothetical protein
MRKARLPIQSLVLRYTAIGSDGMPYPPTPPALVTSNLLERGRRQVRSPQRGHTQVLPGHLNVVRKALIERLPTEILKIIILQSLEANLRPASNEITRAVFQERIYRIFMVQAFWNDPVRYLIILHAEDTSQCSYYPCTRPVDYQELTL